MNFQRTLRCPMKMRSCGLFWHKAVVSLTFASRQTPGHPQQGLLTIARPKVFGGKMEIWLSPHETSITPVSKKETHRRQFGIRYGPWHRCVTLRAPTSTVYETWWAALECALAVPNFVALPIIDARAQQITVAPVLPARSTARPKGSEKLKTVLEVVCEEESLDDIPMLEAGGPSSPTEIDILASWRTWGSLDYFASLSSLTCPLAAIDNTEVAIVDNGESSNDGNSDRISVCSVISEFWSRPSGPEDEVPQDDRTDFAACESKPPVSQKPTSPEPQDDDEWLNQIALFAFRHKVGAARRSSERRPVRSMAGQLHPLLRYALL